MGHLSSKPSTGPKDTEPTLPLNGLRSQAGAKGMFIFHSEYREPPNSDGYTEQGTNSCSPYLQQQADCGGRGQLNIIGKGLCWSI